MNISKKTNVWEFVDDNVIIGLLIALASCGFTAVGCFVDWVTNYKLGSPITPHTGFWNCLVRGVCLGFGLFMITFLIGCIIVLIGCFVRELFDTWKDFLFTVAIVSGIAGYVFVSGKIICYIVGSGSVFIFGMEAFIVTIAVILVVTIIISSILDFLLYTKSTVLPLTEEEMIANDIHNPQDLETFLTNNIYNKMIRCRLVCVANILPALRETYYTSLKLSGFYENDFILDCPKEVLNVVEAATRACEKMSYRMEYWLRGGADWKECHAGEGSILGHCDEILVDCLWDNYKPSKEVTKEEFEAKLGFKTANSSQ